MPIKLTKRCTMSVTDRSEFGTGQVVRYKVEGMPHGEEADIFEHPVEGWQILRTKNGVQGKWTGEYKSADEALAALQRELDGLP